jgi:hypothetical protein
VKVVQVYLSTSKNECNPLIPRIRTSSPVRSHLLAGTMNDRIRSNRLRHDFHMSGLEAARWSVFKYIDAFCNPVRLHQALGYKSSNEFETEYARSWRCNTWTRRCRQLVGYRSPRAAYRTSSNAAGPFPFVGSVFHGQSLERNGASVGSNGFKFRFFISFSIARRPPPPSSSTSIAK